ncbi:MAG: hypothetical protein NTV43_02495 [Methylococcales bacterium]|nr:hypothetical protein [Methylococcales bacterium]
MRSEACHLQGKESRLILLKWLVEFGVQIHASQANELLDMAAYMAKYHNASKNHGADFADAALVFLAARVENPTYFYSRQSGF